MRRIAFYLVALVLWLAVPHSIHADSPNQPILPDSKVIGTGIIYLFANDEAKNSQLNNVLNGIAQLEGTQIGPGEVFSFNEAAHLLDFQIPYDLGPDVHNNLVRAGGVCMLSTMVATAVYDAGLPFVGANGRLVRRPQPHSREILMYQQVNRIGDRQVPIIEASVAIIKDLDTPWRTVQDLRFVNTSGRTLVLHFEASWTRDDLDLNKPLGLVPTDHWLKIELRALYTDFEALLFQANNWLSGSALP